MLKTNPTLALAAALVLAPVAARASEDSAARLFTAPHGEGRWLNRRLTVRHHDQDTPWHASSRHEDVFVARAFTERDGRGRWLNRRLTIRHEGQDAPKA